MGVFQAEKNKILATIPLDIADIEELKALEEKQIKASFIRPDLPKNEAITFRVAIEFYNLLEGFQGNKVPVVLIDNN